MEQTLPTVPAALGTAAPIRRRPPTISVPTPVTFLPPQAPVSNTHKTYASKSPSVDSLAGSANASGGASAIHPAVTAAMQFLSDDMLHTLNKAIDQHNRRERLSSFPSGSSNIRSPECTPSRGGSNSGPALAGQLPHPINNGTGMLTFSLQPPLVTATESPPRANEPSIFPRQDTSPPPFPQVPSNGTTAPFSAHSTTIFEDAAPMGSGSPTPPPPTAMSNPLEPPFSASSSPTPFTRTNSGPPESPATALPTNSPSAAFRKKRPDASAPVLHSATVAGVPSAPPLPPVVQTLPRFDKGLLASALYAMDRSELSQLVLAMADILSYHSSRAGFHFGGGASSSSTSSSSSSLYAMPSTSAIAAAVRVLDPHSNNFTLHSPVVGGHTASFPGVQNSSFYSQHTSAAAALGSLPQSPWGPMSPHQSHFAPRPRPSVAFLHQQRRGLMGTNLQDAGADTHSMPMFPVPVTPQLVTPMMPPHHSNMSGDLLPQNSVSPSSLGTSLTSLANRPTPKLTKHLEQYTDSEGFTTINNYMLLEEAGAGRFGKVCVASVVGSTDLRAIKIIHKSRLRRRWQQLRSASVAMQPSSSVDRFSGGVGGGARSEAAGSDNSLSPPSLPLPQEPAAFANVDDSALLSLNREVAVMKRLRHKNIVPLYEAIDDPHEQALYLVMKYVEKGPIVHLDANWSCPPLDVDFVRCITRQTASGVAYLHRHHIAHRDIKPDNILLGADGVVYLSDFGVSQIFENDDRVTNSDGTPAYAAPEIVRGTEGYSAMKADIWALGVTVYTLVFGCAPFVAPSIFELNEKIARQDVDYSIRDHMSHDDDYDDVIDLLRKMLERDAEKRISAHSVCHHRFVYRGCKRPSTDSAEGNHPHRQSTSQAHHDHHHHHHPHSTLSNVSAMTVSPSAAAKSKGFESGGDSSEGQTSSSSVDVNAGAAPQLRSPTPPPVPSLPMSDLITEEEVMAAFTACR